MTLVAAWAVDPLLRAALGGLLGAIFGSFVGAALVRLPAGRSPISGRSRCDGCGRALGPHELVPVVSYVRSRGRCLACGSTIDWGQPAAELAGLAIGVLAAVTTPGPPAFALSFALGLQLLLLALLDLRHLWLPDRLVLLLAGTGLVATIARFGLGPTLIGHGLAGGIAGFVLLWLPAQGYRWLRGRDGMGAGDPKLLGALGLWLGPVGVVATMLGASLIGLALAAGLALAGRRIGADTPLPFGSALALAGWAVWVGMEGGTAWA